MIQLSRDYAIHQSVWRLMGDGTDRKRDFLYRLDRNESGLPILHMVSARPPNPNDSDWITEAQPYRPVLAEGDRLALRLRLNPTVRADIDGRPGQRHDAIMHYKKHLPEGAKGASEATLVRDATWGWLTKRQVGLGIELEGATFHASGYRRYQIRRDHGKPMDFLGVDVDAELTITEPRAALRLLTEGVGRGRGFGFGLPLVKRI